MDIEPPLNMAHPRDHLAVLVRTNLRGSSVEALRRSRKEVESGLSSVVLLQASYLWCGTVVHIVWSMDARRLEARSIGRRESQRRKLMCQSWLLRVQNNISRGASLRDCVRYSDSP